MIMTTNYVLHFKYEFEIYYLDVTISNDRVGYESIAVSQYPSITTGVRFTLEGDIYGATENF